MHLVVKPFNKVWAGLKKNLNNKDLKLFYEVVNIDGTCGRRLTGSMKDYNPRYIDHWFAIGRCHWNVILPCWLLNNRQVSGKYAIITSELHSAIINKETNEIYDPTYMVSKTPISETIDRLKDYEITDIVYHTARVDLETFKRFADFLPKKHRKEASLILNKIINKTKE